MIESGVKMQDLERMNKDLQQKVVDNKDDSQRSKGSKLLVVDQET